MSHDSSQPFNACAARKQYIIGFIISVFLTVVPFVAVMGGTLAQQSALLLVAAMAVLQVIVQVYYFLHIDTSQKQRWNAFSLGFTLVIVAIVIVGSLWVMYNLNANMMHG
ncbi:cytochrome o ubiquinol oxidase subunit IV [Pasteurellaceae bacterium HPA106]|uniref:cytochrome o ubiquinol oxidase subunit IV n=1 Tax=Spirabiliibacterium pneumoniae TaxID=221400 RepID=UPI001AAC6361|nr:cytochrome o ubiquinol oxidase subunit IV [Spirabiliibacterium pneumoniae]MBE2897175.1 cytochrome o ubiquinol oxidase subunit IV [Spirabiliibacterium pneumoniae]